MALVIVLRAFVPTGYMVGASGEDGRIVLEICSGQTEDFLLFDPETGETVPLGDNGGSHDNRGEPGAGCPFALSATFSLDGLAKDPILLLFVQPRHELPQHYDGYRPNHSRAPPPARAPPVFV